MAGSDNIVQGGRNGARLMRVAALVCVILGAGGIAWILHSVGLDALGSVLANLSPWKFAALLCFYYLSFLFDGLSWRMLIRPEVRPSALTLWGASLSGSAINQFTPTGNLGEPVKVMLLTGKTDVRGAIAALVVWNFLYMIATAAWVMIGAVPIFLFLKADAVFMLLYAAGAVILVLPAFALLAAIRFNVTSRLAGLFGVFGVGRERLDSWQAKVRSVEDAVMVGASERPGDMGLSFVYLMLSRAISISMAFGMVWVLGLDIPFVTVLYIQMLNMAIGVVFSFVPARLGVVEGYNAMIYKALDYTPQAGLAVSVVARTIQVITTLVAVAVLAGPVFRSRAARKSAN